MIQNLGNMVDADVASHQPQRQIVVLRAIHLRPESADFTRDSRSIHPEMTRIHARQKVLRRPIRLVKWIAAEAIFVDLVFVAVDPVRQPAPHYEQWLLPAARPALARHHDRAKR